MFQAFTTPAFTAEAVSSEFIVKFAGFYVEAARRKYINVALNNFDASKYEIVHRNNPMAAYPSDFDVLVSVLSPALLNKLYCNRRAHIRHLHRKTAVLSCHRCLINTGVIK
jgi:hypothetical protein